MGLDLAGREDVKFAHSGRFPQHAAEVITHVQFGISTISIEHYCLQPILGEFIEVIATGIVAVKDLLALGVAFTWIRCRAMLTGTTLGDD